MVDITCVLDARAELGEGTLWDPAAGVLWWIDLWQKLIHRYDPATGSDQTWQAPDCWITWVCAPLAGWRSPWRLDSAL